jgi:hypothetical protein
VKAAVMAASLSLFACRERAPTQVDDQVDALVGIYDAYVLEIEGVGAPLNFRNLPNADHYGSASTRNFFDSATIALLPAQQGQVRLFGHRVYNGCYIIAMSCPDTTSLADSATGSYVVANDSVVVVNRIFLRSAGPQVEFVYAPENLLGWATNGHVRIHFRPRVP